MASILDLDSTRKSLLEALGENSKSYFNLMKLWFQMKSTKEEFDMESRKLISRDNIHLHNAFLLAMLNKCRSVAQNSKIENQNADLKFNSEKTDVFDTSCDINIRMEDGEEDKKKDDHSKRKSFKAKRRREDKGSFEPLDPRDYAKPIATKAVLRHAGEEDEKSGTEVPIPKARFVSQEGGVLPDSGLLMGRLLLNSWEEGLDGAEEKAALLLSHALRMWLRELISAIISRRNGFRLHDHVFRHSMGTPLPNPWLRNVANNMPEFSTTRLAKEMEMKVTPNESDEDDFPNHFPPPRPTLEDAEQMAAFSVACAAKDNYQYTRGSINLFDVFEAFQVHRSIIPSHTVFTINAERISARLSHPSKEEDEAKRLMPFAPKGSWDEDFPVDPPCQRIPV